MDPAAAPDPTTAPSGRGSRPLRAGDPARLGRWLLSGRLGAGGMGTTYVAAGPDGRWAVAKVLRDDLADDPAFLRRFSRELELLRSLEAANTSRVLDADLEADPPYIVMEYVPGPTLDEHVRAYGPLGPGAVRKLARDLATALEAVHGAGVVHRDLKPANVILSTDGARLIDFGVARSLDATSLTRTGVLVGSPGWLAPEQIMGGEVGPSADVFGWAAIVTFAATGRPPFAEGRPERTMYAVLHEEPDLSGVPEDLRPLLARCLQRDADQRPTSSTVLRMLSVPVVREPATPPRSPPPRPPPMAPGPTPVLSPTPAPAPPGIDRPAPPAIHPTGAGRHGLGRRLWFWAGLTGASLVLGVLVGLSWRQLAWSSTWWDLAPESLWAAAFLVPTTAAMALVVLVARHGRWEYAARPRSIVPRVAVLTATVAACVLLGSAAFQSLGQPPYLVVLAFAAPPVLVASRHRAAVLSAAVSAVVTAALLEWFHRAYYAWNYEWHFFVVAPAAALLAFGLVFALISRARDSAPAMPGQ